MNYIHMIHASMNSCSLLYSKVFISKKDQLFEIEMLSIYLYVVLCSLQIANPFKKVVLFACENGLMILYRNVLLNLA